MGTTKLIIQAQGGGWTTTIALVCPQLSHQFLLSWITQKRLKIIHMGWPFTRVHSANSATLSEIQTTPKSLRPWEQNLDPKSPEWPHPEWPQEFKELCREFEYVLLDKLEYAQNITCPPMDVELQLGVKPIFARKPCKTPLHWADKVKKEVKKLVKAGIIEWIPANEQA